MVKKKLDIATEAESANDADESWSASASLHGCGRSGFYLGITSFTPLSTRFPHFLLDIREGINYLKYIRGNQPHGEQNE